MFYFMMHSVNFIYGYVVEQLVKDHSDCEKRKETGCAFSLAALDLLYTVRTGNDKKYLNGSIMKARKEGNILFNGTLNTFYLWLYGVEHVVKDHSDSERGNLLPPHGLHFLISSNGSFICTIPQSELATIRNT